MRICAVGLWHQGTVTAACLASAGHDVTGLDFEDALIADLSEGQPPLFEPGLEELLSKSLQAHRLRFTTDPARALRSAQVVWVTYDTPVDEDDNADVDYVVKRVDRLFPYLRRGQQLLISSQLPVGTCGLLENRFAHARPDVAVAFSYSPENLRLGSAISAFSHPDRVVIGVRSPDSRPLLAEMLAPFTQHIEWMSVESAEMTKHALNAFLAASITFMNEIADLCEEVGADAKEVERGLKTEARIGPRAYLGPGGAFAGGTLARDVSFLAQLARDKGLPLHLIRAVRASNDEHKNWPRRRLLQLLGAVTGKTIAVWGLAYKAGTNTLRRSGSLELCQWLLDQGANVQAHDPAVSRLPDEYRRILVCGSALQAASGADALVVATEWPDYRAVPMAEALALMRGRIVLDANRFLAASLPASTDLIYAAVGMQVQP